MLWGPFLQNLINSCTKYWDFQTNAQTHLQSVRYGESVWHEAQHINTVKSQSAGRGLKGMATGPYLWVGISVRTIATSPHTVPATLPTYCHSTILLTIFWCF